MANNKIILFSWVNNKMSENIYIQHFTNARYWLIPNQLQSLYQEKEVISRFLKTLSFFKTPDYIWQDWNSEEGIFCLCFGDWWSTFLDGCMEISTDTYCTDTFMINWLEGRVILVGKPIGPYRTRTNVVYNIGRAYARERLTSAVI